MTRNKARKVAEDWSSGPNSAMAFFARSGSPELYPGEGKNRILAEIAEATEQAQKADIDTDDLFDLRMFIEKMEL